MGEGITYLSSGAETRLIAQRRPRTFANDGAGNAHGAPRSTGETASSAAFPPSDGGLIETVDGTERRPL